jgi:hypothetical protein
MFFGKFFKKTIKTLIFGAFIIVILCSIHGITVIDCDIDEEGGSLTLAGKELPIESNELIDAYNVIESRASSLIPKELSVAVSKISEWISSLLNPKTS